METAQDYPQPPWLRRLISVFIVLVFMTIAYAHRPAKWMLWWEANRNTTFTPEGNAFFDRTQYNLAQLGHLLGIDNRWEMFSTLHRTNWWFTFHGITEDNESILLPLPRQSHRNAFEDLVIDFREAKFHLNLYGAKDRQAGYANYLCRKYAHIQGKTLRSIQMELHNQALFPRETALTLGYHKFPRAITTPWGNFPCQS